MKKYLILFLSLLMVFQCVIFANAALYDGDSRYTIDVPDKFQSVGENKFLADDKSNIYVSFADNTEEKFCIADMSKKDVKEYADQIVAESEAVFASLGVEATVKVKAAEKVKHPNGQYAFYMVLETSYVKDGETKVNYQKLYEFSGVDNKITFTYTADKKEQLDNADSAFESIVIKEKQAESRLDKLKTAGILAVVVILMVIGVVWFAKRRSKY